MKKKKTSQNNRHKFRYTTEKMNSFKGTLINSISRMSTGLICICCLLILISSVSASNRLEPLHWNANNPLFAQSASRNHLDLNAHIGDSIDLVCPKGTQQHGAEYLTIYKVGSKYEFDNCIINPNNEYTVPILRCDKPQANVKFTLFFVKFSPVPFASEFEEGKEYYFLSTSSGDLKGLNYMTGGVCKQHNMKFSIRINSMPNAHVEAGAQLFKEPTVAASHNVEPPGLLQRLRTTSSINSLAKTGGDETPLPSKLNLISHATANFSFNIYFYLSIYSLIVLFTNQFV